MAKFLFALPRYHTNAAPWVRILQRAGHAVVMHCMTAGPTESYAELTPLWHKASWLSTRLGGRPGADRRFFPPFLSLYRLVRHENPDVVIVRGLTRWFMRMMALVAVLQRRTLVVYDQEPPSPTKFSTWLRRALCRAVGVRHFTPKIHDSGGDTWGSAVQIPFGRPFPPASAESVPRLLLWPPRILMVGKYRDRKRHADLLQALGALGRAGGNANFHLTFCGEEADERDRDFCVRLRRQAAESGIGAQLTFRNNVPHHEMADVYRDHDLFVLPSLAEPAAVSPLEAIWSGCVAIVARQSGTRSYLPPGPDFDFLDGDVTDLTRALSNMIADRQRLVAAQRLCWYRINAIAPDELILERFESFCVSGTRRCRGGTVERAARGGGACCDTEHSVD